MTFESASDRLQQDVYQAFDIESGYAWVMGLKERKGIEIQEISRTKPKTSGLLQFLSDPSPVPVLLSVRDMHPFWLKPLLAALFPTDESYPLVQL